MTDSLELIYVGDPMCSWCWGFVPVLEALERRYRLPLRTVVGGLRPGTGEPVDDEHREHLAHHWEEVARRSGQPFDHASLGEGGLLTGGWCYDTEPACRAVVAMREAGPGLVLPWFAHLQRAFYVEGRDVTDPDVLTDLGRSFAGEQGEGSGPDPDRLAELLIDPEIAERTRADFRLSRRWGIRGFPTLLVRAGDELAVAAPGWVPYGDLEPVVTRWLIDRVGRTEAEDLVRDVDAPDREEVGAPGTDSGT